MNKIIEYMSFGKPIVQFDLREGRFSAADASLYATPNNYREFAEKVVQLVDDEKLRAAMGDAGRRRFEQTLAWEHQVPALLQAYRGLLNG